MLKKIKNIGLLILVLIALILPNVTSAQDNTVRLTSLDFEPYYGPSLENNGFIAEIIKAAYGRSDYTVEFDFMTWTDALNKAQIGEYDGVFTLWYSHERENFFVYSDALPPNELVFFKTTEDTVSYEKYEDLGKYKIGIVKDYTYPEKFLTAGLEFIEYQDDKELLAGVYGNEVDLGIMDKAQAITAVVPTQSIVFMNSLL